MAKLKRWLEKHPNEDKKGKGKEAEKTTGKGKKK